MGSGVRNLGSAIVRAAVRNRRAILAHPAGKLLAQVAADRREKANASVINSEADRLDRQAVADFERKYDPPEASEEYKSPSRHSEQKTFTVPRRLAIMAKKGGGKKGKKKKAGIKKRVRRIGLRAASRGEVGQIIGPKVRKLRLPRLSVDYNIPLPERIEPLGDMISSATANAFSVVYSCAINAGNPKMFPWGSLIGNLFQFYAFEELEFLFDSDCGTSLNLATANIGYYVMTTDYDTLDANVPNMIAAEQLAGFTRAKIFNDATHCIVLNRRRLGAALPRKEWFVAPNGNVPSTGDAHEYNIGNFQFCAQGVAASTNLGTLFVKYRPRFIKAHPPGGSSADSSQQVLHVTFTPVSASNGFAAPVVQFNTLSAAVTADFSVGNTCKLAGVQAGQLWLSFHSAAAASSYTAAAADAAGTNATAANFFCTSGAVDNASGYVSGSGNTSWGSALAFTINASTTVALSAFTCTNPTIVGACLADLWLMPMPLNLKMVLQRKKLSVQRFLQACWEETEDPILSNKILGMMSVLDDRLQRRIEVLEEKTSTVSRVEEVESPVVVSAAAPSRHVSIPIAMTPKSFKW